MSWLMQDVQPQTLVDRKMSPSSSTQEESFGFRAFRPAAQLLRATHPAA
jgi:hypothetical protein